MTRFSGVSMTSFISTSIVRLLRERKLCFQPLRMWSRFLVRVLVISKLMLKSAERILVTAA